MKTTVVELPYGNYKILQEKNGQPVSSDTAFFIETVNHKESRDNQSVLDIGSGNGIISVMLALTNPDWRFTCVEIQEELADLCLSNTESMNERFDVTCTDLRRFTANDKFDLIVSNPPFYKEGTGRLSPSESRNISRFEIACKMDDVIVCIDRNLKPEGKAYVMYPGIRDIDFKSSCRKNNMKIISEFEFVMTNNRRQIIYKIKKT